MPSSRSVPILMYHALEEAPSAISFPPGRFAEQMAWLETAGVRVWTLADLHAWLAAGGPPTDPAVVLTFDDGFRSVLTRALPVLTRHGFRATVFLTTGHAGGRNDWASQPGGIPRWDLLSWAEVRELAAAGMELGAHTVTHPWLPALPFDQARREILESKAAIEDALGRPVGSFAYPYGAYTAPLRALVRESFALACTAGLGRVGKRSDPWTLPRVDVHYVRAPFLFRRLTRRLLTPWLAARRLLRLARRRGRGGEVRGTA